MLKLTVITKLASRFGLLNKERGRLQSIGYSTVQHLPKDRQTNMEMGESNYSISQFSHKDAGNLTRRDIGESISRKDKIDVLVNTLKDLTNSKVAVYSTLDAWVAWERNFPIGSLKNVLIALEKEKQWHRVIQVIKWILSKGHGTTRTTYGQLIQALDMDHRVTEANEIWKKKLGYDLHSVPWKLCKLMISVYYRNNMLEDLVKLFKGLESFDRKPPEKSIVKRVADAYEMLGLPEEKERIMDKYKDLFVATPNCKSKKVRGSMSRTPGRKYEIEKKS